ncbi:hypothetical protein VNO77_23986 [Canavalia gladiata]|uniref:Uncharacterized protein n=1 Tax=Canavalia gladiata TaxID=3824 RepID=A0AAN9L683_CANGL
MVELSLNVGRIHMLSLACLVKWFGQLFVVRHTCMNKGGFSGSASASFTPYLTMKQVTPLTRKLFFKKAGADIGEDKEIMDEDQIA